MPPGNDGSPLTPSRFFGLVPWMRIPVRTHAPTSIGGSFSSRVAGIASLAVGGVAACAAAADAPGGGVAGWVVGTGGPVVSAGGEGGGAAGGGTAGGGGAASCANAYVGASDNPTPMPSAKPKKGSRRLARTRCTPTPPPHLEWPCAATWREDLPSPGLGEKNTPNRFVELMTMFLLNGFALLENE